MKPLGIMLVLVLIFLSHPTAASNESPPEPYLGETPPGLTPELFAPGVVSTEAVNTEADEIYSSVVADGSLYFNSKRPTEARSNLYRAQRQADGGFAEPVNVGSSVNGELWVGDTFVAPDESFMVLTSDLPGGYGSGDLYVSFRNTDGIWGEPVNLGAEINSDILDYCPMVTPDGKYLFFSRRSSEPPDGGWPRVVAGDIYWVDAAVIERLRPGAADTGAEE